MPVKGQKVHTIRVFDTLYDILLDNNFLIPSFMDIAVQDID